MRTSPRLKPLLFVLLGAVAIFAFSIVGFAAEFALGNEQPVASTLKQESAEPEYPDAQTRALAARARERRPVPNSALPPRHLSAEKFPDTLVDRNAIVSGGPPPDGIASIDDPLPEMFDTIGGVDSAGWLNDREPVAVVSLDADTHRIYPLQIMVWHEIVNDTLETSDGTAVPVTVTFCPLCNSVTVFERTIDGEVLDFGTSGALYQSALVMYDRQTESLWTHFDGRSVVGDLLGTKLEHVSASTVSWADARETFAGTDTLVLTQATGQNSPYGTSPYPNYLAAEQPLSGFIVGDLDPRLEAKERVIGVEADETFTAVPLRLLTGDQAAVYELDDVDAVVFWTPGTSSSLDGEQIADGADVGASGVFAPGDDTFSVENGAITDDATGSEWSVLGIATSGPREGERLTPVRHIDTFWFSWVRYNADTLVAS